MDGGRYRTEKISVKDNVANFKNVLRMYCTYMAQY